MEPAEGRAHPLTFVTGIRKSQDGYQRREMTRVRSLGQVYGNVALKQRKGEKAAGERWVGPGMQVGTHVTCLKEANQLVRAGRLDRRV